MRDKARVVKILENGSVSVIPLITDACISCSAVTAGSASCSCSSRVKPFTVSNKKKLPVSAGSVVRIRASAAVQSVQAFFSLLFPVISAVCGYFLAETIAYSAGAASVTEGFRVAGVLVCFAAAAGIVLLVSTITGRSRFAFIDEILSV